jgi:hypothetical protein|tara:strand:- start:39 stop:353 length:315 start_codon:yes stop_codon:yes gene_type:complete
MPYGEKKAYSFFKMKGSPMKRNFGISPVKQTSKTTPTNGKKEKIDDLADVLALFPPAKYVRNIMRKTKKKLHKSKFAQKHLIVPKETKLSKVGEFVKKYIYDPK